MLRRRSWYIDRCSDEIFLLLTIYKPSILKIVAIQDFPDDLIGVDIGPSTIAMFKQDIKNAKTVLFNGPMGIFEYRPFERGTRELYTFAGDLNDVYKVAAGGDTAAAIEHFGWITISPIFRWAEELH